VLCHFGLTKFAKLHNNNIVFLDDILKQYNYTYINLYYAVRTGYDHLSPSGPGLRTVPVIDGLTDGTDGQLSVSVWVCRAPVFIHHMTAVRPSDGSWAHFVIYSQLAVPSFDYIHSILIFTFCKALTRFKCSSKVSRNSLMVLTHRN
jgi:hypothetical protein